MTRKDKKIANTFGTFFPTAVTCLKQSLNLGRNERFTHDFQFEVVNELFTLKALEQLKTSEATGLDSISPHLLKDTTEVISKPLTQIINVNGNTQGCLNVSKYNNLNCVMTKENHEALITQLQR